MINDDTFTKRLQFPINPINSGKFKFRIKRRVKPNVDVEDNDTIQIGPDEKHDDIQIAAESIDQGEDIQKVPGTSIKDKDDEIVKFAGGTMDYLAKLNSHPRDENIVFLEGPHEYIVHGVAGKYTSVTTFNHGMFSHFDAKGIASKILKNPKWKKDPEYKYYQKTLHEILKMWDDNRDIASSAGTAMHLNIEQYYNGIEVENNSIEFQYFKEFLRDYPNLEPYRTEWCVFYEEPVYLSGSIDMVFRDKETGEFFIYDWKRSKDIEYESAYKKTSCVSCISDIPDTNFWHYSLQLNTYRHILESKYNMIISGMFLIVLHPDNQYSTYDRIEVHDMRNRMESIFEYRAKQVSAQNEALIVNSSNDIAGLK